MVYAVHASQLPSGLMACLFKTYQATLSSANVANRSPVFLNRDEALLSALLPVTLLCPMRTTAMEWLIAQPEPSDYDSPMMRVNIAVDNDRSRAKD